MQGTRHPAADTAPQSTLASPALSLEDRLRGMIISHQQHHESRRRNQLEMAHHLPPQGNLTQQQQPHLPPSQVLPNMPPPQNAFSVAPPSLPVPFYLTPQLHPGLGMGAGATASPQLAVAQAPYRSHDGGTPRLVPTQPPLGRNARRPGLVHSYGPASRYPSRQNLASQNSPPPSNFDHFPPLGKEIPKEKQRSLNSVPTQRADQPRGQQPVGPGNRNTKSYQRRPAQALGHYEQFFAEQAFYLDQVTKRLLDKITPPDSAITAKHELLNSLELICKQLSPTAKLIPFGSLVSM